VTNQSTAELVREAATASSDENFLYQRVAALCERVNADAVNLASLSVGQEIAPRCSAWRGMGGVFAESDMDSLVELAQANGVSLKC